MERIASNLRRLATGARERINGKPVQAEPFDIKAANRRKDVS